MRNCEAFSTCALGGPATPARAKQGAMHWVWNVSRPFKSKQFSWSTQNTPTRARTSEREHQGMLRQLNQINLQKSDSACCMPPQNSHRGLGASDRGDDCHNEWVHISLNGTIPQSPSNSMGMLIMSIYILCGAKKQKTRQHWWLQWSVCDQFWWSYMILLC